MNFILKNKQKKENKTDKLKTHTSLKGSKVSGRNLKRGNIAKSCQYLNTVS